MQGELRTGPLGADGGGGVCCCTSAGDGEEQSHTVTLWKYFYDGMGSWRLPGTQWQRSWAEGKTRALQQARSCWLASVHSWLLQKLLERDGEFRC